MKKKITSILLIVCLVVTLIPFTALESNAAVKGTADALVEQALYSEYQGKNLSSVKKAMKKRGYSLWRESYSYAWCAWYVSNCAKHAGIPTSVITRNTYADDGYGSGFEAWAKKQKIYKKSKAYGGSYKPKKGDLIFFAWDSSGIAHIEIVYKVTQKYVYSVGGNTGSGIVAKRKWSLSNSNIAGYAAPKYNTYTVKYSANGGTGTMGSATATLGRYYSSKSNTFKKTGYSFGGWYVKKNNKYWLVKSGSSWKWSTSSSNRKVYSNKYKFMFYGSGSTNHKVNKGDTITLSARWIPNQYAVSYNANGGSEAPGAQTKTYGKTLTLSSVKPVRSGYEFVGWSTNKNAATAQYEVGGKYTANKAITLYAVWKKVVSEDAGYGNNEDDSGSSDSAESFLVTADEYESAYKGNSNYAATPMYRYATRSKLTTSSGKDTVSGYTKYDTKTTTSTSGYKFGTPITTSTSYTSTSKVTKSAVNKGYYYYIYTVAAPSKTSDWTYYGARSRSSVVSYMKQNFSASSVWGESRLRYFWYISSTDLGSTSAKLNKNVPYCADSTVGVGTTSKSGTHLMDLKMYKYSRCYKVKTVTTTNYFYKWTGWSAWSEWTPEYKSASDTVKRDTQVMYLIQAK